MVEPHGSPPNHARRLATEGGLCHIHNRPKRFAKLPQTETQAGHFSAGWAGGTPGQRSKAPTLTAYKRGCAKLAMLVAKACWTGFEPVPSAASTRSSILLSYQHARPKATRERAVKVRFSLRAGARSDTVFSNTAASKHKVRQSLGGPFLIYKAIFCRPRYSNSNAPSKARARPGYHSKGLQKRAVSRAATACQSMEVSGEFKKAYSCARAMAGQCWPPNCARRSRAARPSLHSALSSRSRTTMRPEVGTASSRRSKPLPSL